MNTIEEGNKIIAEFMGAATKSTGNTMHVNIKYWVFPDNSYYPGEDLKYHTSWDWLMPIVEKIEAYDNEEWAFNIFLKEAWLSDRSYRAMAEGKFISANGKTKIEAVWLAVIKFIKYLNQNKIYG